MQVPAGVMRISSDMFAEHERFDGWREEYSHRALRLDIAKERDAPFHADMEFVGDPSCAVVGMSMSACRTMRTAPMLSDGQDDVFCMLPDLGALHLCHRDRELTLDRSTIAFVRSDKTGSIDHGTDNGANVWTFLKLSARRIEGRLRQDDIPLARRLPVADGRIALLCAQAALVRAQAPLVDPDALRLMLEHLCDIVVLVLGPRPDEIERIGLGGVRAARLSILRRHIRGRFREPGLNAAGLAADLGISTRYVHALFESEGSTFGAELTALRLEEARRILQASSSTRRQIGEIALSCGFSDISHFNRLFRARFGLTPREMRWPG